MSVAVEKPSKARLYLELIGLVLGIAAGALSVWQFLVPPVRERAELDGRISVAHELILKFESAGFSVADAQSLVDEGRISEAVDAAVSAVVAPAQGAEFIVGETYLLTEHQVPFVVITLRDDSAHASMNGRTGTYSLGRIFPLPEPAQGCTIMFLGSSTGSQETARFRLNCI
jgi:hypothetical protein